MHQLCESALGRMEEILTFPLLQNPYQFVLSITQFLTVSVKSNERKICVISCNLCCFIWSSAYQIYIPLLIFLKFRFPFHVPNPSAEITTESLDGNFPDGINRLESPISNGSQFLIIKRPCRILSSDKSVQLNGSQETESYHTSLTWACLPAIKLLINYNKIELQN